ncbi:hypothetical protein CVD19_21525 [Bacillus sp. T33-2]|nr:hypothetical protein CVD19_21525 [Bacillus sp. T33-2]
MAGVLLTIEFSNKLSERDKAPYKILNIENAIDTLRQTLEEIQYILRIEPEQQILRSPSSRNTHLFKMNENYLPETTDLFKKITVQRVKEIRSKLVKVDSKTYKMFLEFEDNLEQDYLAVFRPVENQLVHFQKEIINHYIDSESAKVLFGKLSEIELNASEAQKINNLREKYYFSERKYI